MATNARFVRDRSRLFGARATWYFDIGSCRVVARLAGQHCGEPADALESPIQSGLYSKVMGGDLVIRNVVQIWRTVAMSSVLVVMICLSSVIDVGDASNHELARDGVVVKIESVELSRFYGDLASSLEKTGSLLPKIERAIVLTTSITGTSKTAAPRIRLANGTVIDLTIHGNTLRHGVQQVKGVAGTQESWFEIENTLPLDQVFPCSVIVGGCAEKRGYG